MSVEYLDTATVLKIHRRLMIEHGQNAPLISPEKLEAAVARPQASVFGEDAYPSLAEKAASLLQSLLIGHPFQDGNKRVAFASLIVFLFRNGVRVRPPDEPLYDLVIAVATGELREVDAIAGRLRELFTGLA